MPKISRPSDRMANGTLSVTQRTPPRQTPITPGCEHGWDLREVASTYLIAELIRRGENAAIPPGKKLDSIPLAKPVAKPIKTPQEKEPIKKGPSLFG